MSRAKAEPEVRNKRAYDPPAPSDGVRILVDRLLPRGVKKADAGISQWMQQIAPSIELRKWSGTILCSGEESRRRYEAGLAKKRELVGPAVGSRSQGKPDPGLFRAR